MWFFQLQRSRFQASRDPATEAVEALGEVAAVTQEAAGMAAARAAVDNAAEILEAVIKADTPVVCIAAQILRDTQADLAPVIMAEWAAVSAAEVLEAVRWEILPDKRAALELDVKECLEIILPDARAGWEWEMFRDRRAGKEPDRGGQTIQTEQTILPECWADEELISEILRVKRVDQVPVLNGWTTQIERTILRAQLEGKEPIGEIHQELLEDQGRDRPGQIIRITRTIHPVRSADKELIGAVRLSLTPAVMPITIKTARSIRWSVRRPSTR